MTLDEIKLWQRFKNGDTDALGIIFMHYYQQLYFYGLKIVPMPDMVKDVIQEMYIKFWEKRERLGDVKNIKSYLLVSLRRELINSVKTQETDLTEDSIDTGFNISAEDILVSREEDKEISNKLSASMQKLTARQREVIFLRFYNNLDFKELSEVLDLNVQSVRNLLFRSLEKIRYELQQLDVFSTDSTKVQ